MPQEAATAAAPAAAAADRAADPAAVAVVTTGAITATVQMDLRCIGCDYNLRTRPIDGVCPECGQAVRDTLAFPRLSRSAPRWLTSLVDSVTVLLIAFATDLVLLRVGVRGEFLAMALVMIPWGLTWFAVWLLTRPEPGRADRARYADRARAWAMRLLATGPYLVFFLRPGRAPEAALLLSCALPAGFLYYDHLRRAAERLPAPLLARQAGILRWAVPLAGAVSLAALFGGFVGPGRLVFHAVPRPAIPGAADVSFLFDALVGAGGNPLDVPMARLVAGAATIAAVAALVQFRIAFARAVRAARISQQPPAA